MNTVAVYGSLRSGMGNHVLLEHVQDHKVGHVLGYDMYSCGGFPALVPSRYGVATVEVYEVDDATLRRLDQLEGYSNGYQGFYDRTTENIVLEGGGAVQAYVYFMHEAPSSVHVESGDWVKFKKGIDNHYNL